MEQVYLIMDRKTEKIVHIFRDKILAEKYFETACHKENSQLVPIKYADEQFRFMFTQEDYFDNGFHFLSTFKTEKKYRKPVCSKEVFTFKKYNTFLHFKEQPIFLEILDYEPSLVFSFSYHIYTANPLSEKEKYEWKKILLPIFEDIQTRYMENGQSKEEIKSWVDTELSSEKQSKNKGDTNNA